ncbi:hypothetical protein FB45DRAFT_948237 [Roridomyces roridus]|uniref:Acetyl-CoA synthetase-like protein n=1 Tax=Roridomyces roridus TaxID=1738132 RepID=A0AAD7F9Q1_9AGAR|nr:hypothetical protein FB45DRAFT_948237 [Roridomyces roridus]
MNLPTPQGLSSSTFRQPPLDGTLLIPEIFDHHAEHSPNHPLFCYADSTGTVETITWSRATRAIHKAGQVCLEQVGDVEAGNRPVIAILAAADQITYFTTIAGILRAGFQAFPISPRNSDVGVAHLLKSTKCSHVFLSEQKINILPMPTFDDLYAPSESTSSLPPMQKLGLEEPAVILHSSGSTAFPKTITFTFRILMESGLIPYYGQMDLCGHILSAHAVPMFHLMGVILLPWTAFTGLQISVLPPTTPPTVPTPDRVFDGAITTKSSLLFCVPVFLESWARQPHRLSDLQKFRTVIFGGGPLQPAAGNILVEHGVHIAHIYGLTETSNLTMFLPAASPKEGWDYFYISPHVDAVFEPVEDIPGVYHLIVKKTAIHTPAMLDREVDGVPALGTNDLFVRNPTNPKLWKVYGRHDDQIMHSNGEKTNPGPLEAILLKDTRIKHAVMFGRGHFHAGVLMFPAEPFDPADQDKVVEFRRSIWPTIEQANRYAPTHSRMFKEMILVADPSRPVELTAKGTLRRKVVVDMYEEEIRALYEVVDKSSQAHLTAPETLDFASIIEFVRRVVGEVMLKKPGDEEDLFQHGCDSLQATWIRNSLLHAFRHSKRVDMKFVPGNFIYAYPTVRLLADLFTRLAFGFKTRRFMVRKYTQAFPTHQPTGDTPNTEVVLITVYALNRPSKVHERQRASFVTNGLDGQLLESTKLELLEANLTLPELGLCSNKYKELQESVTTIVHNGNIFCFNGRFQYSLPSMEPLVAGTRQLVDFALSSPHAAPPRFVFVSTAGIFRNLDRTKVALEETVSDPQIAVGQGYTESKWVAEQLLAEVAQKTTFFPVIVRPGQLSGAANGAWNSTDWFPVLLRSSQLLGHLPDISGHVTWFPIDHSAKAIVNMRTSDSRYLHIVHPHPAPMSSVMAPLSDALALPLVPYAEWFESLEAAASEESEASKNPGVRLLDFFRSLLPQMPLSSDRDVLSPELSTAVATKVVPEMMDVKPLGVDDARAWVAHLRRVEYLE